MHRLIVIFSPPIRFIFQRNVYLAPIKLLKCQLLKHESAQLHLDLEKMQGSLPLRRGLYIKTEGPSVTVLNTNVFRYQATFSLEN